ncbi:MAG: ThiF family adenylyltransferase, partial [Methanomassiliicoccales archaeon]|nr:ThiF family adenylyltransferase [Methanomassiliicoccales archaeon]
MTAIRAGEEDEDRWGRSKLIGWLDVGRVQAGRYLVLGAGALGNEAMKDLVLSGARNITLVDMDHVVRSNLNRCVMFREHDSAERRWKVDAVAERAADLCPGVRVRAIQGKIENLPEHEWEDHDVVLGCLDNIAARLHANAHSYHRGVPYIDGGTDGFAGRVQVI